MQIAENTRLATFLSFFWHSREAALLVAEDRLQLAKVHARLARERFLFARTWSSTLRQLAMDSPVVALIQAPLTAEFYSLIEQYQLRNGLIQVIHPQSREVTTVHCNPARARLLLVTEIEELTRIEQEYQLRSAVGMIEIV